MFSLAGAAHSHSAKEQGGTVFSRGTNPTPLPVPITKHPPQSSSTFSSHCIPAPWALPCTLDVSIHQLYWRDSKFPPSLTFGGVHPFFLSPERKVEMLLPPPAAVWLLVKVRNHSSRTSLFCLSPVSGAPTSRLWQCCEPAERLKWFLSPELLTHLF